MRDLGESIAVFVIGFAGAWFVLWLFSWWPLR